MPTPEVLVLIPARGGSKGIPRKNIRPFAGHPLIAFSIAAALQAGLVTRVIVSTDDKEIAEVAHQYGAETPFMRPAELAADRTTDLPVFQHALTWLEKHESYRPEIILHLHATSPVRPRGLLDGAIQQMLDHPEADCTRSVVEPLQTPYKMWRIDGETGRMTPLLALSGVIEPYNTPRQLLPPAYLQTGHVNAIRPAAILSGSMTGKVILPWIIDSLYDVDIDTLADWERGEWAVIHKKIDMVWPEEKGMKKLEVLALIPARGGSKGIPRKNIRLFAGYPLIAYSIAAGLQAETVTRVIVTTDDEEIAALSRQYGAETPFLRPAELAQDLTTDLPVFQHALTWLAEHKGYHPDIVVQLRPTTPIRPPDLVDRSVDLLASHPEADSVRGITPAHDTPFKMWLVEDEAKPIRPLVTAPGIAESFNAPRQALPVVYQHTGLIDVIRPATILEQHSMTGKTILPLIFDPAYSADLDTPEDWARAEQMLLSRRLKLVHPGTPRRSMPETVHLLVMDFDGVLTDNRVWVHEDGHEMVAANRSDSLGLSMLRKAGVEAVVISMETNPVVAARCRKMNIPWIQGENDKASALRQLMRERQLDPQACVFLGNDVNDLPCFPLVGWAVAVADAMPEVAQQADFVLRRAGGHAAVRELCDLILAKKRDGSH